MGQSHCGGEVTDRIKSAASAGIGSLGSVAAVMTARREGDTYNNGIELTHPQTQLSHTHSYWWLSSTIEMKAYYGNIPVLAANFMVMELLPPSHLVRYSYHHWWGINVARAPPNQYKKCPISALHAQLWQP